MNQITKYRAETYRIFGLGMLTPFGRIFLDPLSIISTYGKELFLIYFIFTTSIGLFGISMIEKGSVIIENRKIK